MLVATLLPTVAAAQDTTPNPSTDPVGSLPLLTDPFLQAPSTEGVHVVWFTEFAGTGHVALVGDGVPDLSPSELAAAAIGEGDHDDVRRVVADTTTLTRTAEDAASNLPDDRRPAPDDGIVDRDVWRHEATVTGLDPGQRVPYRVVSLGSEGGMAGSGTFSLRAAPAPGEDLRILLTSDHQAKTNTPANLELAQQPIDAVFAAGDLVNVPDRASEWFDDTLGSAFFPALQGNGGREATNGQVYSGGEIIQHAPLYPAVGNHEVQGRRDGKTSLGSSFNSPVPRDVAEAVYETRAEEVNPTGDPDVRAGWIEDNSFSTRTYEEIFTLPEDSPGGETYYATTVGDVRLISLYSTRIWRSPTATPDPAARTATSRYQEAEATLDDPLEQGYGEHLFEAIDASSDQYAWLQEELASDEFANARFRIVMLHEGPQGLGDNVMPPFTDPVRIEETDDDGNVVGIRYEYPAEDNHLLHDLQPLLEDAGVDLVHNGHSHLWNRFEGTNGVTNYLETSNVGNSYGAFHPLSGRTRPVPPEPWDASNYVAVGNPGGLEPRIPTVNPLTDDEGTHLPFVQSNEHTVFSVLDTGTGEITSYVVDLQSPGGEPEVLDRFTIGRPAGGDDGIDLSVTVQDDVRPGEFMWSIERTTPIDLGNAEPAGDHLAASSRLHGVTVTDTRQAGPAWVASAQVTDFASSNGILPARLLGWTPELEAAGGDAVAGPPVPSGRLSGPGLSEPAVLGSAPSGHQPGSTTLGAELHLELPPDTRAGRYTTTLTVTALG